mmetsp:Transcript_14797/g.23457  ORF Transcript_14797/g.23457 Transcript_14797/m.23457 type:complete len:126 (+) Transcript_14797:1-378(+)
MLASGSSDLFCSRPFLVHFLLKAWIYPFAMAGLEERYQKAVAFVGAWDAGKTMPNDRKLLCYGFFKQAAVGDVDSDQPYAVQFEKRSKWDAWNAVKGMSKEDAMKNYIEELEKQIKEFDPQNPGF